jgi:hypothetical protein
MADYFLFARNSPVIGETHDFRRESASTLTLIQTVLQQLLVPSSTPGHS